MATDIAVVKKLEWRDHRGHTFPDTWTAKTPCGVYEIEERSASDSLAYVVTGPLYIFIADTDSLDEAKASAQADHERRILSALSQDYLDLKASHDAAVAALRDVATFAWLYSGKMECVEGDEALAAIGETVRAALTTPAAPAEADDGWIAWAGGKRPVSGLTEVEVKLRGEPGIVEYASRLDWAHFNNESDIVAYRVRPAAGGAL